MELSVNSFLQGGKYRIVRYISSGGFGCTYEAEHVLLGKRVAIKEFFVKDFCNRDERTCQVIVGTESKKGLVGKLRKKFIDEARALSGLHHPGIVSVSDVFEENGTAYYVMDYIDGCSLSDLVRREGPLSESRALGYIRQVCAALSYVHAHGRLHLDIKPGNIMIDQEGNAILIDFGASKQYDEYGGENTSTLMGRTPGYAPLEQLGNDVVKFLPATDIYAVGATLYKLLTGVTPLSATRLASGESLPPLPAQVSASTRKAVALAMCLNKMQRPQKVSDFLNQLEETTTINVYENNKTINVIWKSYNGTMKLCSIFVILFYGLSWLFCSFIFTNQSIFLTNGYYGDLESIIRIIIHIIIPYIGFWGVIKLMYNDLKNCFIPLIGYLICIPFSIMTSDETSTAIVDVIFILCNAFIYALYYWVKNKSFKGKLLISSKINENIGLKSWTIWSKICIWILMIILLIAIIGVGSNKHIAYYRFGFCELLAVTFCAYLIMTNKIIGFYLIIPILGIGYAANYFYFRNIDHFGWIVEQSITASMFFLLFSMSIKVRGKNTLDILY